MKAERRQQAFDSIERVAEAPMLVLSLAMAPLLLAPLLLDLSPAVENRQKRLLIGQPAPLA